MKKIILWSVAGILILGICCGAIWWMSRPQVIQLDKSTTLTLLGVEYGKHHKFPKISTTGRRVGGQASSFDTTNDTVVVWVLQTTKGQNRYGWEPLVCDRAETACVTTWARNWNSAGMNKQIAAVQLDAFPRRDSKFVMRFESWGTGGQHVTKDGFVISNPTHGKTFPKWSPDPLPDAQSDGDLSVTLNKLAIAQSPYNRGNGVPKTDPINKGIQVDFDVQQNGHPATNWNPVQVETSDATGNNVRGWINQFRQNGQPSGYFYQPGLWPDESAWKVRVEFSRTSGFNDDEIWSVTNVPVRAGTEQDLQNYWSYGGNPNRQKPAFAETNMNDTHVQLFPAVQYTSQNNNGQKQIGFVLRTDPDPEISGMRVSLVSITDDQGREIQGHNYSWGGGSYQFQMSNRNTQTINITVAVHKSRFVEFTVKPTKQ